MFRTLLFLLWLPGYAAYGQINQQPKPLQQQIGGIINNYTPVLGLNPCNNKITVEDGNAFKIGDTVLLIQMKGALIDSTNTASFGTITDYRNAGNYEFNYVKSKSGNLIELRNILTKQYNFTIGKVQLIRVPYFEDAEVTSTLTCLPWDGSKGGVLVLNVDNKLTLNGNIDVTGRGFMGGRVNNPKNDSYYCHENEFYYSNDPIKAAPKGEGISAISLLRSFGKGSLANGGGGGSEHNAGGGGGSNSGNAGSGGNEWITCSPPSANGGIGGNQLTYDNTLNKVFLGGGGGGGHCDNTPGFNANGGNGGGIILIRASIIESNTFSILANGGAGIECARDGQNFKCHEGMGGGGGGGAVIIESNSYIDNLTVEIKGGKGADMNGELAGKLGPGGGGGGGLCWFSNSALPVNVAILKDGGINGVNIDFGRDSFGATPGEDGATLFNLKIPVSTLPFRSNIDSVRIAVSSTSCSSNNFKGLAYTNTDPISVWRWNLGDGSTAATQDVSHTYASTANYTVKLVVTDVKGCTDSVSRPVPVSSGLDFDFNYQRDVCTPLSVQFTGVGNSDQNPTWSFGDNSVTSGTTNPVHNYTSPGTYIVSYVLNNGSCKDSVTKTIDISILRENILLTRDTTICFGSTKKLLTQPSLGFCWSPATFLDDPLSSTPTTSTPANITYYYTGEVTGNNIIVNGDFNSGNSGFISAYKFGNPNITEGQYFTGPNPSAWNPSLSSCGDHTTGTGNMMMINGAPQANVNVWEQTVAVIPNTSYAFSTWIQALWPPNPAQLNFSINGNDVGRLITASLPTCNWTQFYITWNSGSNTSAKISIVNKNTAVQGNDFALDDISFAPVFIKRDSVVITIDTPVVRTNGDLSGCSGLSFQLNATGSATYKWSPATRLNDPNLSSPVASPTTTTQYIVTGVSSAGCSVKDSVLITILPKPIIIKTPDTMICRNNSLQLSATGGVAYNWTPAAALNNPGVFNPVANPGATTTYYVTVTADNSCTNEDSVKVTLRPDPIFAVNAPISTCINSPAQLSASGGSVYEWLPASTLDNPAIPSPVASPAGNTTYSVRITDAFCNLSATLTTTVSVKPLPVIRATSSNDIDCSNDQSRLAATGALLYTWSPAAGLNDPSSASPVASPTSSIVYIVKGTDAAGCVGSSSVAINVTANNKSGYLMPTAFSPNNDGLNDCYGMKYWGVIQDLNFSIYNRFGEKVFEASRPGDCWDGRYKGIDQDPAVFIYIIRAKTSCENEVFKKGAFTLLR